MAYRRDENKPSAPRTVHAGTNAIDARYGLEPVFEPGREGGADRRADGCELRRIRCPYCGERQETLIDASAGSANYFEDCQVCCRPIEFHVEIDAGGTLVALETLRSD
ncbi:MAG TPA: CPXCG motif-containing cysteine-rich protein [Steroidobacteraceae bacterium]|nr:CPXCG motif-containing cysteine-rich protein [Steroidobacteraceae bacterium]